jgi:hypothetical protein
MPECSGFVAGIIGFVVTTRHQKGQSWHRIFS